MNTEQLKGEWNQIVGIAKQTWSRITHDELLGIEGDVQRLSGLLQERYAVTKEQADKEITAFLLTIKKQLGLDAANEKQPAAARSRSRRSRTA